VAKFTCRKCGAQNPEESSRCVACDSPLEVVIAQGHPTAPRDGKRGLSVLLDPISALLGRRPKRSEESGLTAPQPPPLQAPTRMLSGMPGPGPVVPGTGPGGTVTPDSQPRAVPVVRQAPSEQPSVPLPHLSQTPQGIAPPLKPGEIFYERYHLRTSNPLSYSVYYDAVDLFCPHPQCHGKHADLPSGGLCAYCHQPLDTVVIHERQLLDSVGHRDLIQALLPLGRAGHPRILHHRSMLWFQLLAYTTVNHPGQWTPLVHLQRPCAADDAVAVVAQMGRALTYLHQQGFAYTSGSRKGASREAMEGWVVLNGGDVKLADLGSCSPLLANEVGRTQIAEDIAFLGQCLVFLIFDPETAASGDHAHVPAEIHRCVERAQAGYYGSVLDLLNDLSVMPESPAAGRMLKPTEGHATHTGRRHSHNEDMISVFTFDKKQQGKSVPVSFYVVADGMGGHDAGNVASRTVNDIVTRWIIDTSILPDLRKTTRKLTTENVPAEILKQAIQAANEALLQRAEVRSSDTGSTVTAALVIGDVATIANVGDSRTYLLRRGQLRQITQDHSLVARLVEAKVIAPEDVHQHPQRNRIYRSLGHKPAVKVDTFGVNLQPDDRLILCCDGLWGMVQDAEIQHIVESARTPQKACDALVAAANRAGGEDNISVIVVEME
jgi:PPM family protein phosphatase